MLAATVKFGPPSAGVSADDADNAVWDYLAALYRSGQIGREASVTSFRDGFAASTAVALPGAWRGRYLSQWGRRALAGLGTAFGRRPTWTLLGLPHAARERRWSRSEAFVLFTNAFDSDTPVADLESGARIPLCRLPLDDELRDQVVCWSQEYQDLDRVWLGSGKLELPSYRELAAPDGDLAREGRAVCRSVESATSIPTYYYLMRYWARRRDERTRPCPSCGRGWARTAFGFIDFEFRCDPCRLVSNAGPEPAPARRSAIGDRRAP